jgi:hypothetical protein
MTDFRTALDDQIGKLPRSRVDVDAVIARQRTVGRLRLAAGAGALATAVAGITGALVLTAAPSGGSAPATVGAAPTASSGVPTRSPAATCPSVPSRPEPSRSPWISADARPTTFPGEASALPVGAEDRLTAALTAAVRAELGTLRLASADDRAPLQFSGGPCDPDRPSEYSASALVRTATGAPAGRLTVLVQSGGSTACVPLPKAKGDGDDCAVGNGPNGETIYTKTQRGDLQGELVVRVTVVVVKPDGTMLQLLSTGPGGLTRPPALGIAALTRIGLAPGLALTG